MDFKKGIIGNDSTQEESIISNASKLTSNIFEWFYLAFQDAARRQVGLSEIPLDYLLRPNEIGNYDAVWNSREEKIENCVIFVGQSYKDDYKILYTILVQHFCTSGPGWNIIANHNTSKNGWRCYLGLRGHSLKDPQDHTKNQHAEKKISEATYLGVKRNCKIEDYYIIISKAFNDHE